MPAPDVVLNPSYKASALDQTLGCMTGLFHMFEGHPAFMSRRYSSTRLSIHSGLEGQFRTQAESQSHRHDPLNNRVSSKVDKKVVQHHRSHSDVTGDLAMAVSSRPLPEFHTLKDGHVEPGYSDGITVDALAFYTNESLRAAALFAGDSRQRSESVDQREYRKRNVVLLPKARPKDNVDMSSTDITDAILASFQRDVDQRPNSSFSSYQGCRRSDHGPCQIQDMKGVVSGKSVDLPRRSPSVFARNSHEPSDLVNWKEGLRSSASPSRKLSHHNSPERRVEPKKDHRGRSPARDHYNPFASMSPKKIAGAPNLQESRRHGEILNQDYSFKESPGASDFRESLRPFLGGIVQERVNQNVVPAEESSNLVQGVFHQMSNRDSADLHSVVPNVIARLMGLEEIPSNSIQEASIPSSRVPDHAKSKLGGSFFRGLVQFDPQNMRPTSPPAPCTQPKIECNVEQPASGSYEYRAYQDNYPAQFKLEQELCKEDRDYELHLDSMPFLPFKEEFEAHPASGQFAEYPSASATQAEIDTTSTVAPGKKKKMIRKILEAMRPKGLLKISHRKQEKVLSPVTKLIINDSDVQLLEKQQQSVSPPIKVVSPTGLKLVPSEVTPENKEPHPRCTTSDTSSVKQVAQEVQLQADCSTNSSESSVVKPCILEPDANKIVVMKPKTKSQIMSIAGNYILNQVESTASSTSTDIEMAPTRRRRRTAHLTKKIEESPNLAKDQRRAMKPVKPRAASNNSPRRAGSKTRTLESDYESEDPSSTTKSNDVNRESRKIRTATRKRTSTPSSKSPTPDIHRQIRHHRRYLSPDSACPSPIKDHCKVDRKLAVVTKAKKGSKATPSTNPKTQLAKEETFKKRDSEKVDCGSRALENAKPTLEKPAAKEAFSIRSPGRTRAPRKVDANSRSSKSDGSNSALLRPVSAGLPETLGDELPEVLERSKDPHVHRRHTPPEVQTSIKGGHSVGDQHSGDMNYTQVEESTTIEVISEELLTTPRGRIPLPEICENLDSKLDEGQLDRPSPVSVLDANIAFGEDLTPSPSSPKVHSKFPVLQDSETTRKDEGFETVCDRDILEAPSALTGDSDDLDFDGLFSKCAERLRVQVESTITKNRIHKFQTYFKDTELDEESTFVERFLLEHNKLNHNNNSNATKSQVSISEKLLLESLESNGMLQDTNRMLLLDCLEEIMERVLESSKQPNVMNLIWGGLPSETMICESTRGQQLEQELWMEVRDIKLVPVPPSSSSDSDICDIVHRLLQRDFIRCQGRQWLTFTKEREQIGIDMEHMILQDMIEVAVSDLCALQWRNPSQAPRRQLFTN